MPPPLGTNVSENIFRFLRVKKTMTNYRLYPALPKEPLDPQAYCLQVVQGKQQELVRLKERTEKKHEKYSKVSDQLTWLNVCSSGLSMASGISRMAMFSMFIGFTVSTPVGAVSLAGVISGMAIELTKKYQKKLTKVRKLTDIITSALAVFETSVSKVLNNVKIDELEFSMIQTLYYELLNDLSNIDRKMEAEISKNG